MKAMTGDRIVLAPPNVEGATRDGEIIEVRGPDGSPPYLVRWSDGHEGLFFPGAGAVLSVGHGEHQDAALAAAATAAAHESEQAARVASAGQHPTSLPAGARHVHDWTVRISLYESDDSTAAHAVLVADAPDQLSARGHSYRNPRDRAVPEIGDEVAVARALRHLADRLLATAELDIEAVTGQEAHLAPQ